jgi:stress-induced-phosphoprotein 1
LKIDPKFVKIYIRKAKIQYFLQQYHKALETYSKGLDLAPDSSELMEGRAQTLEKINMENATGQVDPKRRQEALKDPEIQSILRDPIINKVLGDMQSDPASAQAALKDAGIMSKLEKLIAAGVLQAKSA